MTTAEFILFCAAYDASTLTNPAFATVARNATGRALEKKHERAKDGWISYRPKNWLDHAMTATDQSDFTDALKELESARLLETERDKTGRANWVRLTKAGQTKARDVARTYNLNLPQRIVPDETLADRLEWLANLWPGEREAYVRNEIKKLPKADLELRWEDRSQSKDQERGAVIYSRIYKQTRTLPLSGTPYEVAGRIVGYIDEGSK